MARFTPIPPAKRDELTADALIAARIQDAVLAERERCAKIADEEADDPHGSNPGCATAEAIAAAIRSGK